ncbi:MAG: bifunctional pyr operon transcriptional regulator/uracil phosphoribosyltransferase PyrR [Candidatus Methylacidiphilales bacterium]
MNEHLAMDAATMRRSVIRLAHEILENNPPTEPLALLGIHSRGVPLAQRLLKVILELDSQRNVLGSGSLDISFHRDDWGSKLPVPQDTEVSFDIEGQRVVLVDDVLFTGRTIRAALNALNDLGRPSVIRLAVLIDRGHRQLPIRADYVGKNVPTRFVDKVVCHLEEVDGEDSVWVRSVEETA